MNKKVVELLPCYECGWLGLCVIACPLRDLATTISSECTTTPGLEQDEPFQVLLEPQPAPSDDTGGGS